MSKRHKKRCRGFNYVGHLLIVIYTITGCVFICISVIGLKICAITARIKKYKSIIRKKRKSMIKYHC